MSAEFLCILDSFLSLQVGYHDVFFLLLLLRPDRLEAFSPLFDLLLFDDLLAVLNLGLLVEVLDH